MRILESRLDEKRENMEEIEEKLNIYSMELVQKQRELEKCDNILESIYEEKESYRKNKIENMHLEK